MSLTDSLRRYLEGAEADIALLTGLAGLIRDRLLRASMWGHSPEYFGYPEYHSWKEAFCEADTSPGPVVDFFLEKIVPERDFLLKSIQAGNSVEALLRQKVRWFLSDRQKAHDPIGYRVFANMVATVTSMIDDRAATATNLVRGKIRNPTVIRLAAAPPASPIGANELAHLIDCDPAWSPVLLRLTKLGVGAQRLLRERLDAFPAAGIAAFQIGEFGDLLKVRARAANLARNQPTGDRDTSSMESDNAQFRTNESDNRYSLSDNDLALLGQRVREAVEQSGFTAKVRRHMLVVLDDLLKHLALGQNPPAVREWALQLGLSKSSLNEYRKNLQPIMESVLAGNLSN